MTRATSIVTIVLALLFLAALGSSQAQGADKDCGDFGSQAAAQDHLDADPSDPDGLDADGDGVACESNPCPCSDGGGGGGPGGSGGPPPPSSGGGSGAAMVVSVTDGDTISVERKGRDIDIRIIGIDTPEVFFGAECGGAEASSSMKRLLSPGDRVRLIRDRSQDNVDDFGRSLRYVEKRGRDVGRRQVRKGWAKVFVFESPFDRTRSYRRARDSARQGDRGVWSMCGGDFHQPL